jgi:hypothetical protein
MRRIISVTALALALILVGGTFTTASAATTTGSSDHGRVTTIHSIVREVDSAQLDLGAPGLSLGDQLISTNDSFQDGRRMGEGHVVCTVTRITGTAPSRTVTSECLVTVILARGQITIQGAVTGPEQGAGPPFYNAVTGGTGAYRTARGEVHLIRINDTDADVTIRLIL